MILLLAWRVCRDCFVAAVVVAFVVAMLLAAVVADSVPHLHLPAAVKAVVDYDAPVVVVDLAVPSPVHCS